MGVSVCDACGVKTSEYNDALCESSGLPESWFLRKINDRDYSLCDCCGSFRQFKGGMSPYLQDVLGLGVDARCEDLGAEVRIMAAARAERRKKRVSRA